MKNVSIKKQIEKISCFIPVGGHGNRLRPLTHNVSKPCIRFLNRPLIEFSIAELAKKGVRNFIFGEFGYTNYVNLFDQYGEGVGVSAKYKINPRLHIKHQPNVDDLGSAHSLLLNMDYYDIQELILVVQGDNLFKFDLEDFVKLHKERDALMSIALVKVEDTRQYGVADLGDKMRIKSFIEKPSPEKAPSKLASAGIYLFSPEIREVLSSDDVKLIMEERKRLDFGYDFIPYLVESGFPVYGYPIKVWYDVGTPERYLQAMYDVLNGRLDIRITEQRLLPRRNIWVQGFSQDSIKRRNDIIRKYRERRLFLEGAVLIGRHTRIGDYSSIADSNIDNFCILDDHSYINKSVIMDGSRIGAHTHIRDSIIGRKVIIESSHEHPTLIERNSVIGSTCHVKEGCRLLGTRVNPGLIIPRGMTYIDKFLHSYEDIVQLSS
jgi:NDP-sugar pyrophosphorylase family protein